ncbi:MAG: homocysteine S-methyltransferase family protein [Eubacterium sp.]|nr:homocysteine S-methyltransferase family protein [Eubacterium sp.]
MTFQELLKEKEFIILDGGFGTQLAARLDVMPEVPETVNITHPEVVSAIHRSYIDAGSDLIYTCTFGANSYKLKDSPYSVSEIVKSAVANARKATEGTGALIALDIGPIGRMMEPNGDMSFDEAYDIFSEVVKAGEGTDLIVCETMTDLYELRAAVLSAKENSTLPVICTMTFEKGGRTFSGTEASSMALTMSGLGVSALGINCSLGPSDFIPILDEITKWTDLPIIAKPNAGLPDPVTGQYMIGPDEFAREASGFAEHGAKLVGGCCGTTPEYIKALKAAYSSKSYQHQEHRPFSAVCTAEKTVEIDRPLIIGERINPTGKKALKEAIKEGNYGYILELALKESEEGASILDVNAGVPQVDEKQVIVDIVKKLQGNVTAPLQIDSGNVDAIEAALRVYAGKAIINSVNGNESSLSSVLPVAAKYGAAVVGLTLDEKGIPKTARERVAIAEKILDRALSYGIRKEDVFIDCLTLTVSAEPDSSNQTLDALQEVKNRLGLKTVLGVSNISFGLPARSVVNAAFLQMALSRGLDLPIMDPGDPLMIRALDTNALITGKDKNAASYIAKYINLDVSSETSGSLNTSNADHNTEDVERQNSTDLVYLIQNGLEEKVCDTVRSMLEHEDPLDVISQKLIPVMDRTGEDFEKGRIFIPQLLTAAKTAQKAFDVVKDKIAETGQEGPSRGTIIIATVKGDVHDIGKNIAKVVLDNYGYEIIDLGKDVSPETILDKAKETGARLVGLSALMTTTLPNMEKTVKLIKEKAPGCFVMAGGAVVTEEYARMIGADFYVPDAQASAKAAGAVYDKEL